MKDNCSGFTCIARNEGFEVWKLVEAGIEFNPESSAKIPHVLYIHRAPIKGRESAALK